MGPLTQWPVLWSSSQPKAHPLSIQTENATNLSHVFVWRGIIARGTSVTAQLPTPASSWLQYTQKCAISANYALNATSFTETRYLISLVGRNGQTDFISLVCSTHGLERNSKLYKLLRYEMVITGLETLYSDGWNVGLQTLSDQCQKTSETCYCNDMNMLLRKRKSSRT